jgi:hypothetical protein
MVAGYEHWWRMIAGADFQASGIPDVSVARRNKTVFVTMPHATAHGLHNTYFDRVGELIATAKGI